MAVQKPIYVAYQSKSNTTGLVDVKGQVYLNGVAKAVGASSLVFAEQDATNSPGLYYLTIPAATATAWGVSQATLNDLVVVVNSATKPAETFTRFEVQFATTDDIDLKLGTPSGASVSADIAAVKGDTAAIKIDLESGTNNLGVIVALLNTIKNNTGFSVPVPPELLIPSSGSNAYVIPVTIYNEANTLIDPDSNTITVSVVNQAGTSRASYLSSTTMTRASLGQYTIGVTIPSTAPEEQLIFSFAYSINSNPTVRKATTIVETDVSAAGFALQSTLLATQTTVNANNALLTDSTNGLSAIKAAGMANNALLTNGTYGLAALQAMEALSQGSGFNSSTDSLKQLSLAIANIGVGGKAV